jgi:hypothetical protein
VGAFSKKAAKIAPLKPDILVVQEAEPLDDVLLFAGEQQPTFRHRAQCGLSSRGLATLSYTGIQMACVDEDAPLDGFRRYEANMDGLHFNVVAAWTWETEDKSRYRQVHRGLQIHADWIHQRPTFLLGDLNDNASFENGRRWRDFMELIGQVGLVSAYHSYFREPFGEESRPTHHHHGYPDRPFHLDYCFLPETWASRITDIQVGRLTDWSDVSDHMPLIVDVDLAGAVTSG